MGTRTHAKLPEGAADRRILGHQFVNGELTIDYKVGEGLKRTLAFYGATVTEEHFDEKAVKTADLFLDGDWTVKNLDKFAREHEVDGYPTSGDKAAKLAHLNKSGIDPKGSASTDDEDEADEPTEQTLPEEFVDGGPVASDTDGISDASVRND